jgi:hypothetical protein
MKMERSENKTKKKQKIAIIFASKRNNAKGKRKTPITFASRRNEAKQKRKKAIIFASKRNERKIVSLRCEKSVFFACFRIKSETKMKLSENKAKKRLFRFALKRNEKIGSETKRNEAKRKNYESETERKYALLISLWSEAKNSKRNEAKRSEKNVVFFHVSVQNACETDLVSLRFALKRKIFFCKTGAP